MPTRDEDDQPNVDEMEMDPLPIRRPRPQPRVDVPAVEMEPVQDGRLQRREEPAQGERPQRQEEPAGMRDIDAGEKTSTQPGGNVLAVEMRSIPEVEISMQEEM